MQERESGSLFDSPQLELWNGCVGMEYHWSGVSDQLTLSARPFWILIQYSVQSSDVIESLIRNETCFPRETWAKTRCKRVAEE